MICRWFLVEKRSSPICPWTYDVRSLRHRDLPVDSIMYAARAISVFIRGPIKADATASFHWSLWPARPSPLRISGEAQNRKKKPSAASFWFVLNLPRWVKTIFRTAPTFGRLPSLLSMGRLGNFQGYLTIKKRENPFLDDRHWLPLARWVDLIEFSTSDMIYRTATVF